MSSTQNRRGSRSRAPSPDSDRVQVKLIVESWVQGVEVNSEPVKVFVRKTTDSEALAKVIEDAVYKRVKSRPTSWVEPHMARIAVIGNDENKPPFSETQHDKLGDYPTDADGIITCVIALTGKQPAYAKCIVLGPLATTNDSARTMSVELMESAEPADSMEPAEQVDPGEPVEARDEDTTIGDNSQLVMQHSSANHSYPRRVIHLRIDFVGMTWTRIKTVRLPLHATYDMMTKEFVPAINYLVRPDALECLVY